MSDQEARFAIELATHGAKEGDDLADALARLQGQIKQDMAAISELQSALKRLQVGGSVNVAVFKQLRDQLSAKKASLASAQESYVKLGGAFGEVKNAAKTTGSGLEDLLSTAQSTGGPLGQLAGIGGRLKSVLGKGGAAGAVLLLVAALALVMVGAVAAVVALARFALGAADAARSQRLLLEAATGSKDAAGALAAQIDNVAGRVATLRGPLEDMALSLARSGLQGRALDAALSAVATTSAVMGQAAGSALQGIAERARLARRFALGLFDLQGTGLKLADVAQALAKRLNVSFATAQAAIQNGAVKVEDGLDALDDAVQAKFGKLAKAQLLGFTFQLQKARENLGRLFAGVNVDRFLEAMHEVLSVFDQGTVTGRTLRIVAETMLNPLFDAVASVGPVAKAFFQGMVIGALLVAIAVLKVRNSLRDAFGGSTKSNIDWIKVAMYAGIVAFGLMAGAAVALSVAFGLVAVSLLFAAAPFLIVLALIFALIAGVGFLVMAVLNGFGAAVAYLRKLDFGEIGRNLVDGFVNGVTARIGQAVAAVKQLGQSAMGALKSTLGIASPSKVFAEFGGYTAEGFARGVEDGSGRVGSAVDAMVEVPSKPSVVGGKARASSGGNTYIFNISGVSNAETLREPSFLARLVDALESAAQQSGIGLEPEAV